MHACAMNSPTSTSVAEVVRDDTDGKGESDSPTADEPAATEEAVP